MPAPSDRRYLGRRSSPMGGASVMVIDPPPGALEQGRVPTVEEVAAYGPNLKTRALNPRHDLRNHSPDGFQWGYGGSGPAQLALALCADALNDDERAQRQYQTFKANVVARITGDTWELTAGGIIAEVESYERAEACQP